MRRAYALIPGLTLAAMAPTFSAASNPTLDDAARFQSALYSLAIQPIDRPFGTCARCETCGGDSFEALDEDGATHWESQPCVYDACRWRSWCYCGALDPLCLGAMEVWNAVVSGDAAVMIAAVKSHPKQVILNSARQSVQMLGCDGTSVVANIPISEDELALLATDL